MDTPIRAAAKVQDVLDRQRWKYCFIGGIAVQKGGQPRFTQDVGLTVFTGFGGEEAVIDALLEWFPFAEGLGSTLGIYRLVPAATLFVTFYGLFFALTPARYRKRHCRKWPGALLITVWWLATVEILPNVLGLLGGYSLTYGSLAGVMISLIFFFIVGLGVVTGAELNAALAESRATALKGEVYTGPYTDQLEVEEPQPGEDVEVVLEPGGPQL